MLPRKGDLYRLEDNRTGDCREAGDTGKTEKAEERAEAADLEPGDVFQTDSVSNPEKGETVPHGEGDDEHVDSWLVTDKGVEEQRNPVDDNPVDDEED